MEHTERIKDKGCDVVLLRKFGAAICILVTSHSEIYIEDSAKFVQKINVSKCMENLKLKLFVN